MFNEYLKMTAQIGLKNQVHRAGDYTNQKGLLVCGTCGELRQMFTDLITPTEENPNCTTQIKVTRKCKCDLAEEEKAKMIEEKEKHDEYVKYLRSESMIEDKFSNATFDSFESTKYNERNLKLCKRYVTAFDEMAKKNQGLLFWGGVGTGKTFASACIANYLLERKVRVIMTSFVKVLESIQKNPDSEAGLLEDLQKAKLVIFDDLGAERTSEYALEKVYNIINSRSNMNLPMIITTNLSLDEIQEESNIRLKRIYDRILEICYPMQFTGPSWRKKSAFERFNEMEVFFNEE